MRATLNRLTTGARTTLALLLCALLLSTACEPVSPAGAATSGSAMGVHRGSNPPEIPKYEQWIGTSVPWVVDFWGRGPDWSKYDNPGWVARQWQGSGRQVSYSLAMLPNFTTTLEAGARGEYNEHWRKLGAGFVANGAASSVLRIGWEFNGPFYPWAAGGKESQYVAYWRQIVNTLRSVPGQSFRFDWTPLAGNTHANVEAAYPGNDYVDIIGLDAYDNSPVHTNVQARWADVRDRRYGLAWHRAFAASKGKPVSFPEWGLTVRPKDNLGGGDNPYYIEQMHAWLTTSTLAYAAYFEYDASDASHRLMTPQFPSSAAVFKRLFAGGLPGGLATPTTAPPSTAPVPPTTVPPTTVPPTNPIVTTPAQSKLVRVSRHAVRDPSWVLSGSLASYDVYAFVPHVTGIVKVEFWVDDPLRTGPPLNVETSAPWDLAGGTETTARAFDARKLPNGEHTLTATVHHGNGTIELRHATWIVKR